MISQLIRFLFVSPEKWRVNMDNGMTLMLIIMAPIVALFLIIAAFLFCGKGAFLIAGYNTMGKKDQAKYDEKALCRAVAWVLVVSAVSCALLPVGTYFESGWLIGLAVVAMTVFPVGFAIYANTGKRFLIDPDDPETAGGMSKVGRIAMISITAVILIGCVILNYQGTKDPAVSVLDNGVRINGMYGLSVDYADITGVILINQSMAEIGPGMRVNGYGGAGQARKGHFSGKNGEILLFVQSNTSPTIHIEREGRAVKDIYISLRDSRETERLYYELKTAVANSRLR